MSVISDSLGIFSIELLDICPVVFGNLSLIYVVAVNLSALLVCLLLVLASICIYLQPHMAVGLAIHYHERIFAIENWRVSFRVELYGVMLTRKSAITLTADAVAPDDLVDEALFPEDLIHHDLHVVPHMPIQMHINGARIRQQLPHQDQARRDHGEVRRGAIAPGIGIRKLLNHRGLLLQFQAR